MRAGKWQEARIFFFEKKKQKTFLTCDDLLGQPAPNEKSFFASFFPKKEDSSCHLPSSAHPA
jgi:hypothetical protein